MSIIKLLLSLLSICDIILGILAVLGKPTLTATPSGTSGGGGAYFAQDAVRVYFTCRHSNPNIRYFRFLKNGNVWFDWNTNGPYDLNVWKDRYPFDAADAGTYTCIAKEKRDSQDVSEPSDPITLTLESAPDVNNVVLTVPAATTIVAGADVTLTCSGDGDPDMYQFVKKLGGSAMTILREYDRNATFEIKAIAPTDEGTYECRAIKGGGIGIASVQAIALHAICGGSGGAACEGDAGDVECVNDKVCQCKTGLTGKYVGLRGSCKVLQPKLTADQDGSDCTKSLTLKCSKGTASADAHFIFTKAGVDQGTWSATASDSGSHTIDKDKMDVTNFGEWACKAADSDQGRIASDPSKEKVAVVCKGCDTHGTCKAVDEYSECKNKECSCKTPGKTFGACPIPSATKDASGPTGGSGQINPSGDDSTASIIGAVVGSLVLVGCGVVGVYCWWNRRGGQAAPLGRGAEDVGGADDGASTPDDQPAITPHESSVDAPGLQAGSTSGQ